MNPKTQYGAHLNAAHIPGLLVVAHVVRAILAFYHSVSVSVGLSEVLRWQKTPIRQT